VWDGVADIHSVEIEIDKGGRGYRLAQTWDCPLLEQAKEPPRDVAALCTDFHGRKYFISPEPVSYPVAQSLALKLKGRLLTISSPEENQFIAEQARGVGLWMAGWRPADRGLEWRDERNRPLRYLSHWDVNQPDAAWSMQWNLAVFTNGGTARWHDVEPSWGGLHACLEWGEE
jgi:hypothetical protein